MGSVAYLVSVLVLAALVIGKVADMFPDIDTIGWVMVGAGFAALIGMGIAVEPLVQRLPWGWANANEKRRMGVITVVLWLLMLLIMWLVWPWIGPLLAPHFGPAH